MPRSSPSQDRASLRWRSLFTTAFSIPQLYVFAAAVLVLFNAQLFYGYLRLQTEHVSLWFDPDAFKAFTQGIGEPHWSAPLDDVFIHLDFARATARGYPFEWVEGNGYSSGGTSLLYPFVLALGYLAGFQGLSLLHWTALVACVCTFATLLGARSLFEKLPEWTCLLAPPFLLAVGALNWTLFSGMEVALFLALWSLCAVVLLKLLDAIEKGTATRLLALSLGFASALLVAGRPEAAPLVAVFGVWSAALWWKRGRLGPALWTLVLVGAPGAVVVLAHMAANKLLTGDAAAAGALAKLEMHHPYMTSPEVWDSWWFFLKYQFLRLSDYHFGAPIADIPGSGYLLWPLALSSLCFNKTRRVGALLLSSAVIWFGLVALNGQVRWQNERYCMPAVAWILLSAAVGVGGILDWALAKERHRSARTTTALGLALVVGLFFVGQAPRFESQVWFFGRASRNILEQHVRAGGALRETRPALHRILLSDAGALPYVADTAAFDLIGLGGYGHLPIARASRQGVGAAIELLEHVPISELPDVMALYPSWWGDFVLWFGSYVDEFPVRGNVICGGASMVIYAPRWAPILHSGQPISLAETDRLVDSLDLADVLSEDAHNAHWDREAQGYVSMKMLPDARNPNSDLWDAGRLLAQGMTLSFDLRGAKTENGQLLLRMAPAAAVTLELRVDGKVQPPIVVQAADHWQEVAVLVETNGEQTHFDLKPIEGEVHLYHVFLVETLQRDFVLQPASLQKAP